MQEYCLLQDLPELCCYTIWAVFIYPAVISLGFAFLINTVLKDGQLLFNLFSSVPCNWGKLYIPLQRHSNSRHHLLNCLYVQEVIVGCCSTWIYCGLLSHKLWWIQASGKGFFFFSSGKKTNRWWEKGFRKQNSVIWLLSHWLHTACLISV